MSKTLIATTTLPDELPEAFFQMYTAQGTLKDFINRGLCDDQVTADEFLALITKAELITALKSHSDRFANFRISQAQANTVHPDVTVEITSA